ncbi:Enoyl-CoA hydratase/carnithine racemase [Methylobacterium sp. ap11]|nr:Enoyl-CoA hydratase/carnithine racemase [Methylobacterium sp. ap11]
MNAPTEISAEPPAHRSEVRLWLRLLTTANTIEAEIRRRLRDRFDTTLPRFDLLAQLERAPDGIQLGELSRRMMVSNGNVTGLVERLAQEELIDRQVSETDRRAVQVRLTARGRAVFTEMARAHADWIAELVGALDPAEQDALSTQLSALKASVRPGGTKSKPKRQGGTMRRQNAIAAPLAGFTPQHFGFAIEGGIATVTLNRPEKKNPLTFESYAELRDTFRALRFEESVTAVVITGAGGNFSSGGDVFEIIEPLTAMGAADLHAFTTMTGDLVKEMRACPQPVVAAVEGVCAGAGAIIAMASDLRVAGTGAKVAFLFNKVGLAGCDMGACAILPRIIGQGRASELLYTGRFMSAEEGERWGFFNRLVPAGEALSTARETARALTQGPAYANGLTKRMLHMEWAMGVDAAIDAEAMAQALCMKTQDFRRAFEAFAGKTKPVFEGN